MPLSHLEHFLILTDDMEGTRDWWVNVLGLTEGPHPDFGFPVYWLYIGDTDVLHIGAAQASDSQKLYLGDTRGKAGGDTGALDHIAFRASGLDEIMDRLKRHDVPFTDRRVDNQALFQLFLHDPNGVKVELNFSADEVKDRRASVMAEDLR